MRPLSLDERLRSASVSLGDLLSGSRKTVVGATDIALTDYTDEILASGLPGVRPIAGRARRLQLEGYVDRIVDRDIPDDAGVVIRNPAALRRWMAAYAATSSTTATFETIRDAASEPNMSMTGCRDGCPYASVRGAPVDPAIPPSGSNFAAIRFPSFAPASCCGM